MRGGPVQLMAFGYSSGVGAEDRVLAELDALQGRRVLRLLDFLFVSKTPDGNLVMLDVGDDEDYGTILAGFFEPSADEAQLPDEIDADHLIELAESLAPGAAMALVLVEHLWAGALFSAVEEFGGELVSEGFITDDGRVIIGGSAEMTAGAEEGGATDAGFARIWGDEALEDAEIAEAEAELHNFEAFEERQATERFVAGIEAGMEAAGAEAGPKVTEADRALLADLGTDLTFAMIADHLGISRGAAKERASRLYHKLGVHSRAQAVDEATRLGLLGG